MATKEQWATAKQYIAQYPHTRGNIRILDAEFTVAGSDKSILLIPAGVESAGQLLNRKTGEWQAL